MKNKDFAGVWPTRQGKIADGINNMPKYVASRTLKEPLTQLVDEFRFLVFPFAFGTGPRIFEQMGMNALKLVETKTFSSGVIALHYEPQKFA